MTHSHSVLSSENSNQLFNLFKIAKNTKKVIKALNNSVWESVIEY